MSTIPTPSTFTPVQPTPGATATEAVFEAILADIVRGTYSAGARLPAERELARMLGASRPTLREALRRLGEWQLVEPRRGSGVVVRPIREWSIEVLPAFLKYARPENSQTTIPRLLTDMMALRRSLIRDIVRLVAPRIPPGGTTAARAALARSWAVRDQPSLFPREDFGIMRSVVESANFLPAIWTLNRLAGVYLDIAVTIAQNGFRPPDDYLESHDRLFVALEKNDADAAAGHIADYLERHDAKLLGILGVMS
jgi:GntR family transcriptional regulator, transcriptional repressor for pyruvate dehydrogenase complex